MEEEKKEDGGGVSSGVVSERISEVVLGEHRSRRAREGEEHIQ